MSIGYSSSVQLQLVSHKPLKSFREDGTQLESNQLLKPRTPKPEAMNPKAYSLNSKSESLNLKPYTVILEAKVPNPKLSSLNS